MKKNMESELYKDEKMNEEWVGEGEVERNR